MTPKEHPSPSHKHPKPVSTTTTLWISVLLPSRCRFIQPHTTASPRLRYRSTLLTVGAVPKLVCVTSRIVQHSTATCRQSCHVERRTACATNRPTAAVAPAVTARAVSTTSVSEHLLDGHLRVSGARQLTLWCTGLTSPQLGPYDFEVRATALTSSTLKVQGSRCSR